MSIQYRINLALLIFAVLAVTGPTRAQIPPAKPAPLARPLGQAAAPYKKDAQNSLPI